MSELILKTPDCKRSQIRKENIQLNTFPEPLQYFILRQIIPDDEIALTHIEREISCRKSYFVYSTKAIYKNNP